MSWAKAQLMTIDPLNHHQLADQQRVPHIHCFFYIAQRAYLSEFPLSSRKQLLFALRNVSMLGEPSSQIEKCVFLVSVQEAVGRQKGQTWTREQSPGLSGEKER